MSEIQQCTAYYSSLGASQVALVIKNPPANAGDIRDQSLIPGWERSPAGGNGNPLQYSCLENLRDRGAWLQSMDYTELDITEHMAAAATAATSLQLCLTLCDPVDGSPPGSLVPGILQARTLEWVAISFSRGSSQPRDRTHVSYVSCIGRWVLYH